MKPQPLSKICKFLGKRPSEAEQLIGDGLPIIKVPAKTKHVRKVLMSALHAWLSDSAENIAPTYEGLCRDYSNFLTRLADEKSKPKS